MRDVYILNRGVEGEMANGARVLRHQPNIIKQHSHFAAPKECRMFHAVLLLLYYCRSLSA